MPLSSRRRRRKPIVLKYPRLHPAGKSPLESLPVEILCNIFVASQNTEFVFTSKTIYAVLGQNPSEWLFLEFFSYDNERKIDQLQIIDFKLLLSLNLSRTLLNYVDFHSPSTSSG
jgi:hypothetical protein